MKKLIIVALGVCILGTACSRDNNLAEKNTLQQPLEQSVMLQTEEIEIQSTKESSSEQEIILLSEEPAEPVSLSEPEHMEGSAAASVEERDLTKSTTELYNVMGDSLSKRLFVHFQTSTGRKPPTDAHPHLPLPQRLSQARIQYPQVE